MVQMANAVLWDKPTMRFGLPQSTALAITEALRNAQLNCFELIEPELIRFPSLDPDALRGKIEAFIADLERNPEEENL
jgi:hypothetical protein